MKDDEAEMRPEYDFSRGERGRYAGKRIVIVGPPDDGADEEGVRQMPASFSLELEEEFRLAEEAARRREQAGPDDRGDELDGWTVERGSHPLPPDVAARLAGRDVRSELLAMCQQDECGRCLGFAFTDDATIKCSHFCHGTEDAAGGLPN